MTRLAVLILLTGCACWSAGLKPVSSAEVCGRCHRAILEAWKLSAHADAMALGVESEA